MLRLNLACLSTLALGLVCFNLHAGPLPSRAAFEYNGVNSSNGVPDTSGMTPALALANTSPDAPKKSEARETPKAKKSAERKSATRKSTVRKSATRKKSADKQKADKKRAATKGRTKADKKVNTKRATSKRKAKPSRASKRADKTVKKKRVVRRPPPPLPEPTYTPLERALKESLTLEVVDNGPYERWDVHIRNQGSEPLRVAADSRLLSFEAIVPGSKKPVQCRLPPAMLPSRRQVRYVYLRPSETHTFRVDPRMYCFETGDQTTLVPGAFLHARYGWPEKTKTRWSWGRRYEERLTQTAPFVAVLPHSRRPRSSQAVESTPIENNGPPPVVEDGEEVADRVDEGIKQLQGEGFALRSDYKGWSRARLPKDDLGDRPGKDLKLAITYGSDSPNPRDITIRVELQNLSDEPQRVYFRSDLVSFRVRGPDGTTECEAIGAERRAPDPQAFSTIGAGKRSSFTVRLLEFCPLESFARPGFYYISAVLPATSRGTLSDEDVFTGRLATSAPRPVRLHNAELPFLIKRRPEALSRAGGPSNTRPAAGRISPRPAQNNPSSPQPPQSQSPQPQPAQAQPPQPQAPQSQPSPQPQAPPPPPRPPR